MSKEKELRKLIRKEIFEQIKTGELSEGGFFDFIDRVIAKASAKDPKIKRLRQSMSQNEKTIKDMLIKRFGSLDKVPSGYRKVFLDKLNVKV